MDVEERPFRVYVVHPWAPLEFRQADPNRGSAARHGSLGSGSAPMPRACAGFPPGVKGDKETLAEWTCDRRRRRRVVALSVDNQHLNAQPWGKCRPQPSSLTAE